MLLTFLRWLSANTSFDFDVLLLQDGPLRADFAALATTHVVDELSGRRHLRSRIANRLATKDAEHWMARAAEKLRHRRYDLVYGNSIVCLAWVDFLRRHERMRAICHVHETTWMIDRYFPRAAASAALARVDLVIACSRSVAEALSRDFDVDLGATEVAHSFVGDVEAARDLATVRRGLGFAPGERIVGGMGTPELRKGVDLLAPLAAHVRRLEPTMRLRLIWVGVTAQSEELVSLCLGDAARLGVADCMTFLPRTDRPDDYLDVMEVVVVPSREEPLSLVALAAGVLEKPVVAFERAGGIEEVLADGGGRTVPFLDLTAMAGAVVELLNDAPLRRSLGARGHARVDRSFRVDVVAPQIGALIDRTLARRSPVAATART